MPNYILAYHGGKIPQSPEEGVEQMDKWEAWADGLGDLSVNRVTPLGNAKIVGFSGVIEEGGVNPLIGYSIIKAENIDVAVKLVEVSPHVYNSGTMIVAEMMEMGSC